MWGKEKAQKKLLEGLEDHFLKIHRTYSIPVGDFPDVHKFRQTMDVHDLSKFPKLDSKAIHAQEEVLTSDIPRLMAMFPQEGTNHAGVSNVGDSLSHLAVQQPPQPQLTYAPPPQQPPAPVYAPAPAPVPAPMPVPAAAPPPYQQQMPGPFDAPAAPAPSDWTITPADKQKYDQVFQTLAPQNGFISGAAVRPVLERSGLAVDMLRQVWNLSDIDRDGHLDADEFSVAMHLTRELAAGTMPQAPATLPLSLIPPSKR